MNVDDLLARLAKPYWMPEDPKIVVCNMTPDHYGQLNLTWVLAGRRAIRQGFFDRHMDKWELAGLACCVMLNGVSVRDYATLYSEHEFAGFLERSPLRRGFPQLARAFGVQHAA